MKDYSDYVWYFCTSVPYHARESMEQKRSQGQRATQREWQATAEYHGTGVLIKKALVKHLTEISALGGRLCHLKLASTPNIHIFSA